MPEVLVCLNLSIFSIFTGLILPGVVFYRAVLQWTMTECNINNGLMFFSELFELRKIMVLRRNLLV